MLKKSTPAFFVVVITGCLYLYVAEIMWHASTYGTVDYDEATNTVYGFAYTQSDYSSSLYYDTAYVRVWLKDASGNILADASNQNYGRAEVSVQAPGNGNEPYRVETYHKTWASYFVYNYWNSYNGRYENGYLDYYYYTYYERGLGGNLYNNPLYFYFLGRRPGYARPSRDMWLGNLLTALRPLSIDDSVVFKTANVGSSTVDFDSVSRRATIRASDTGLRNDICSANVDDLRFFKLTVNFRLPERGVLAERRCTVRALGNIRSTEGDDPQYFVEPSSIKCVMDDSFNKLGHIEALLKRRGAGEPDRRASVSVGVGCDFNSPPGVCDTKNNVRILCGN